MWNTMNLASDTRRAFTRSVNGLYQELGPQGMMARRLFTPFVCRLYLLDELSRHQLSHGRRVLHEPKRHSEAAVMGKLGAGNPAPVVQLAAINGAHRTISFSPGMTRSAFFL